MLVLIICIVISALIGVIFKYFVKFHIDSYQAIVYNYLACLVIGTLITGSIPFKGSDLAAPWFLFAILLGCLFIMGFNIMALTIRYFGITLTTVMQKMSLLLSAGFAILVYHEAATSLKIAGILCALPAIILINRKSRIFVDKTRHIFYYLAFPILTFLVSGLLEVILYYVKAESLTIDADLEFTTHAFSIAGIIGFIILAMLYASGKSRFAWRHLIAGILLGIPNYFSVYLILRLLNAGFPGSTLFPVLNISILVLSAMAGVFLFTEPLRRDNALGLLLAIISILLISLS